MFTGVGAARRLASRLRERGLRPGRGTRREHGDQRPPAQRGALFLDLAVELDVFVGEVEQADDLLVGKAVDPQQMTAAEGERVLASNVRYSRALGGVGGVGQGRAGAVHRRSMLIMLTVAAPAVESACFGEDVPSMRRAASTSTHEIFNQSPPFWNVDLFATDRALLQGTLWWCRTPCERGEAAALSEVQATAVGALQRDHSIQHPAGTPSWCIRLLRLRYGAVVEFHPRYHQLMAEAFRDGMHCVDLECGRRASERYRKSSTRGAVRLRRRSSTHHVPDAMTRGVGVGAGC